MTVFKNTWHLLPRDVLITLNISLKNYFRNNLDNCLIDEIKRLG